MSIQATIAFLSARQPKMAAMMNFQFRTSHFSHVRTNALSNLPQYMQNFILFRMVKRVCQSDESLSHTLKRAERLHNRLALHHFSFALIPKPTLMFLPKLDHDVKVHKISETDFS